MDAVYRLKATRLNADAVDEAAKRAKDSRTQQIDNQIDNLQKQITNLKKSMPSRQNRMSVDPKSRINLQKQILNKKQQIADLRLKKVQTKSAQ